MPGTRYEQHELIAMSREDFAVAASNNFERPDPQADRPAAAGVSLGSSVPVSDAQPSANAWAKQKSSGARDFTAPSGQICQLRKVTPEMLIAVGILDRVTRLEGLADALVQKAEGQPPAAAKVPTRAEFEDLLEVINIIVPLAVLQPKIWADDEKLPEGMSETDAVRVSDIDLEDRVSIMEEALKGLKALDRFRHTR